MQRKKINILKIRLLPLLLGSVLNISCIAQKIDSVKVYCLPFNSDLSFQIDEYSIMAYGDSILFTKHKDCQILFRKTNSLVKKNISAKKISSLREIYKSSMVDIRVLLIFFSSNNRYSFAISPQKFIVVNHKVFVRREVDMKRLFFIPEALRKLLFPSS
jgi:hypothetical protein